MKIVVTGREGQVVSCLLDAVQRRQDIDVVALGRPDLDLSEPSGVAEAIVAAKPDLVVSAAAYTAVDQAEDEPELAFRVNAQGAGAVAQAATLLGVPVIHLSTDYVFAGDKDGAYSEDDATGPTGVYGASKLAGEQAVAAANPRHLILRTAWVYSTHGKNFAKTMLRLAETRDELSVVADQWGNPTSAHDIADGVLHIAEWLRHNQGFNQWGVYHLAGRGDVNWSGFARHILDTSQRHAGPFAQVKDIATSDYPTKARRPANSRLNTTKLMATFGWTSPRWQDATETVVKTIVRQATKRTETGAA